MWNLDRLCEQREAGDEAVSISNPILALVPAERRDTLIAERKVAAALEHPRGLDNLLRRRQIELQILH